MNAVQLLPLVRELYSRRPETRRFMAWELQWLLYALNYTNKLENEDAIEAARDVALTDYDPDRRAA